MDSYCHESGLILKLIKGITTHVCKYEIDSISNGGRVRNRMKNGEGG